MLRDLLYILPSEDGERGMTEENRESERVGAPETRTFCLLTLSSCLWEAVVEEPPSQSYIFTTIILKLMGSQSLTVILIHH